MGHPVLDSLFVAFLGLALGALHAPAQAPAQQPPHRWVGKRHSSQPLDDHGDAIQGPHVGREPMGERALK